MTKFSSSLLAVTILAGGACLVTVDGANAAGADGPPSALATGPANGPLWRESGGGFLPALGSVAANIPCQTITLSLKRDTTTTEPPAPKLVGTPATCSAVSVYTGYMRDTLFLEGLDARGGRLFVVTGPNPGHQDVEAPPPGAGPNWKSSDTPIPIVSTLIRAPLTPALARLRWYDVDENYHARVIGESAWVVSAPSKP